MTVQKSKIMRRVCSEKEDLNNDNSDKEQSENRLSKREKSGTVTLPRGNWTNTIPKNKTGN